jgi:hypothetical protein
MDADTMYHINTMGGGIDGADTAPTSLIVNLWIYTAVPITALNTKESGNNERDIADMRLAGSRDEFELSYRQAVATSAGILCGSVGG